MDAARLVERILELGLDTDLCRWVQSFLADRKIQLVIDQQQCQVQSIESGVPQGSPVSPILFTIYLGV